MANGRLAHRRFRSCLLGVRAEMLPQAFPRYLDLELYLAWRSGELRIETLSSAFRYHAGQAVMVGLHGSPLRKPDQLRQRRLKRHAPGTSTYCWRRWTTAARRTRIWRGRRQARGSTSKVRRQLLAAAGGRRAGPADGGRGTGIAPLRSMMIEALSRPVPPRISVVYSARSVDELAYRDDLEALAANRRIDLVLTVTRDEGSEWTGTRGRIDRPCWRPRCQPRARGA